MMMPLTGAQMLQIVKFLKTHHLMILFAFVFTELWLRFCETRAVYYGIGRFVAVKQSHALRCACFVLLLLLLLMIIMAIGFMAH
jgi:hypothetical protein